jgi:hypothetical protein
LFLLRSFELKKEKYKNFHIWAKRYPIPVNLTSLVENLNGFDKYYDLTSAKDCIRSKQQAGPGEESK